MSARFRSMLATLGVALLVFGLVPAGVSGQDREADREIAMHLADILRAGRSVVSARQALINDPDIGDKAFTGDALVRDADAIFADQYGAGWRDVARSDRDQKLTAALIEAMASVVDEHQADINRAGVGFKGFIPAVFSRLAGEEFAALAGTEARIRVTAPIELVRNRKSRPDDWERQVIETRFLDRDWAEGEPYTETVELDGRPAFRMMFPEYYRSSCLQCHGGPKGATDITGYPKEGAEEGDLGGVISITIFQ